MLHFGQGIARAQHRGGIIAPPTLQQRQIRAVPKGHARTSQPMLRRLGPGNASGLERLAYVPE